MAAFLFAFSINAGGNEVNQFGKKICKNVDFSVDKSPPPVRRYKYKNNTSTKEKGENRYDYLP